MSEKHNMYVFTEYHKQGFFKESGVLFTKTGNKQSMKR